MHSHLIPAHLSFFPSESPTRVSCCHILAGERPDGRFLYGNILLFHGSSPTAPALAMIARQTSDTPLLPHAILSGPYFERNFGTVLKQQHQERLHAAVACSKTTLHGVTAKIGSLVINKQLQPQLNGFGVLLLPEDIAEKDLTGAPPVSQHLSLVNGTSTASPSMATRAVRYHIHLPTELEAAA